MATAKSVTRFNWAARKIHKRLTQLGASEAYPRGEADEQHEEGSAAFAVILQGYRLILNEGLMLVSFRGPMTCVVTF